MVEMEKKMEIRSVYGQVGDCNSAILEKKIPSESIGREVGDRGKKSARITDATTAE